MNRAVPDEIVEAIRARADIVDLVQSYIPLKKAGQTFKACCPFHQEKTPSFTVNPVRQIFHCFGCGKGGDVFRFVMERENVDFPNAIHILARKYNVYIPEERERRGSAPLKPEEKPDFKERLYTLHEKILEWFERNLSIKPEIPVAKYLATRKLPEDFIQKFHLGASVDSWDAAATWARREGFTDQELIAGGLLVESSDHPGRFYDRFRNRLMFPIWNEQGRVVGFSARAIEAESFGGKYVNSPETPIFKKSRVLYGLHFARAQIGKSGFALLCEGQLDVIAMHRAGFENSVAPQGTAFTEEQARMLKRYTGTLHLALDSDAAGQKAILRCAELALPAGFEVKVVRFPSGKDPDELLKTVGAEAIADSVAKACDFFEFLYDKLAAENDLSSPSGKSALASEALRFIGLLESDVAKASYVEWLSSKTGMDQGALFSAMDKQARQPQRNRIRELAVESAKTDAAQAERKSMSNASRSILRLFDIAVHDEAAAKAILASLSEIVIGDHYGPEGRALEAVLQATLNGEWDSAPAQAMAALGSQTDCPAITALLAAETFSGNPKHMEKELSDCANFILLDEFRRQELECKSQMASLAPGSDAFTACLIKATNLRRKCLELVNPRKGKSHTVIPPIAPLPPSTEPAPQVEPELPAADVPAAAPEPAPAPAQASPPPPSPSYDDGIPEDIVIEDETQDAEELDSPF